MKIYSWGMLASLLHADPPPLLDGLQRAENVGDAPVPRARRAHDAVVLGVWDAVALPARLLRHRVGERGDAIADGRVAHQLGVDDDPDAVVDVGVALAEVEAVKLGARDEVQDALHAPAARLLDVGVEPLDEPPAAKRGAPDWPRLGNPLADALGVHVRPVGEVEVGVRGHRVPARGR